MNEIITVTGKGKISLPPDTIIINISLETVRDTYEATMDASADAVSLLRDALKSEDFEKEDIKTKRFNVDLEYESYKERDNWKKRFIGYKCNHDLKIEFLSDSKRLAKILSLIARCLINPEFSIQYKIKDMEDAKNQLLAKAVADSKAKAEILTKAAGVKLGKVVNINYSWGEINIYSEPVNYDRAILCEESACSYESSLDIEPEDLDITDTVTVTWEILS